MKSLLLEKNLKRKTIKLSTSPQRLLIIGAIYFESPNFIKVNFPKHVCVWRNHGLFLIKTFWSYFK